MIKLWYPGADLRPGPAEKTYGVAEDIWGLTCHSSEGYIAGDMAVLDRVEGSGRASWALYNPKRGRMLQHYALNLITWHSGSMRGWGTIGIENEGKAGEPLTVNQNDNLIELFAWCMTKGESGWRELNRDILKEHNFFVNTLCPSDRILWGFLIRAANQVIDALGGATMPPTPVPDTALEAHIKADAWRRAFVGFALTVAGKWMRGEELTDQEKDVLRALGSAK